jgi:hypothetical protein
LKRTSTLFSWIGYDELNSSPSEQKEVLMKQDPKNDTLGKPKAEKSWRDSAGEAIEKVGHKISDAGAPKIGQKIHDLGDKLEDSHANPSHPHKV